MTNYEDDSEYASAEEVLEQIEEQRAQQAADEDAVETVLSNAIQRIEEANVWKLLISQEVIERGSASELVVNSVNSQLKRFGLERLEILLGMQDLKVNKAKPVMQQFDAEEEKALKILAAKVLGRSVSAVVAAASEPKLTTVASEPNKEPRLKTVAAPQAFKQNRPQAPAPRPRPQQRERQNLPTRGRTSVPEDSKVDKGFAVAQGVAPIAMPNSGAIPQGMLPGMLPMNIKAEAGLNVNSAGLLGQIVNQLTSGQMVHADMGNPAEHIGDNADERF